MSSDQHIFQGAKEIADKMQDNKNFEDVSRRLAYDMQTMSPQDYRKLLNHIEVLQENKINCPDHGPYNEQMHVQVGEADKDGLPKVTLVDDNSGAFGLLKKTQDINVNEDRLVGRAMGADNADRCADQIETKT